MVCGFRKIVVKPGDEVITVEPSACALGVEESLTLGGCVFGGLALILLFKQFAALLFNKSAGKRCYVHGGGC
jgi:hypothetical protein